MSERKSSPHFRMNAFKETVKPVDKKLIINLPDRFANVSEFEVTILPADEKAKSRKDLFGKYEGKISMSDDFNSPVEDFRDYM